MSKPQTIAECSDGDIVETLVEGRQMLVRLMIPFAKGDWLARRVSLDPYGESREHVPVKGTAPVIRLVKDSSKGT